MLTFIKKKQRKEKSWESKEIHYKFFLMLNKLMKCNSIPILVNVCEINKLNERRRIIESSNE